MFNQIINTLEKREKPIDIIVVGLGFMGFGFISSIKYLQGMRVSLLISRRPDDSAKELNEKGLIAKVVTSINEIKENREKNIISISSDLKFIEDLDSDLVFEVTGTVVYGTEVAKRALEAGKHVVTMNPELQTATGTQLTKIAKKSGLVFTDVVGDQPGSLSAMISHAKLMGFDIVVAGNMKRFMNRYATQKEMQQWADDKGLAVRQTVSFTDGTKQSIEMTLVGNYFGMGIIKPGMIGPEVEDIKEALNKFDLDNIPQGGVVDYVIGKTLFPGIFLIVKHKDVNQQKYLRYLGLGDGPYYILFEPYHLCHLEVGGTIARAVLYGQETINNGTNPILKTAVYAKRDLKKGETLDGIGGNLSYGNIDIAKNVKVGLPMGLSEGCVLTRDIKKDELVTVDSVILPKNAATRLLDVLPLN